jgi:hypothetical protein
MATEATRSVALLFTFSELRERLGLKDDVEIMGVWRDWAGRGVCWVLVEHPDLPPLYKWDHPSPVQVSRLLDTDRFRRLFKGYDAPSD